MIIEKSRDLMISWLCVGFFTHAAMTNDQREVLFQSQKEDKAAELVDYAKTLYEEQDQQLKRRFPLAKPLREQAALRLEFGNGSRITGIPEGADQIRYTGRVQKFLVVLSLFCALSVHAADSKRTVRRLPVENYHKLPSRVAAVLRSRRCTIPQPDQDGPARNVVRGEFFRKGQKGWAVLCSSGDKSSILVFRDDHDAVQMRSPSPPMSGSSSMLGRVVSSIRGKSRRWTKVSSFATTMLMAD